MKRILYHILFWFGFTLLFAYQNFNAPLEDYLTWFWILFISATTVYINLYYLLPKYFFKKKYILYFSLLLVLIVAFAPLIKLGTKTANKFLEYNFFQEIVNLFFFVVITSSLKFYREFQRKQARLIKVENEQLKTELRLLKAQVNPHFLFNTLSNLYGLIIQNKNQQASEVTLKLSDLMRYLLDSSKSESVKLSEEIQFIEDYLALEKIRLSQNANIKLTVSGIDSQVHIAPLLFIPFVENAFKHGLQSLRKNCYAHFTIAKQGNELFFEAENSLGEHLNQVPSGTGLDNIKKRLELIYPEKHLLEIEETDTFYKALLQITL
ncbi:MAG: histidine kinase [Winogradskyella sp.]|uniref:sensor histidine kinase n=1 Tax=Winogradskyella sp. TaxID=1883156 RepID=UPI0025E357E8|nr:histidine kinase [Winogradskyella sp.]NRB59435.1 histidine kinase [Winogradskyella sp.]